MILTDTGPLVALLDSGDEHHERCLTTIQHVGPEPMITTMACLTEAMYLLGRAVGYSGQEAIWQLRRSGSLFLHYGTEDELSAVDRLMRRYSDIPMDFADATLVATAESLGLSRIFTLDKHFYAYRLNGSESFAVIP